MLQLATCDTHRSTRTAQHELRNATRQEAAAVGANAESEGADKARQCERSELCDGRLKEKERGGRGGKRKGGGQGRGGGEGLGAAHLAKAQQRAERAQRAHRAQRGKVQARHGRRSQLCDGGLK